MSWEVRNQESQTTQVGMSAQVVREYVARGIFSPEDWGRSTPESEWRQLATIDEFEDVVAKGARRYRPASNVSDSLDMTPMIDMTFLLLIFFMVTATFHMQKGLDFPPDKTSTDAPSAQNLPGIDDFVDRIIVEINERDKYSFRQGGSQNTGAEAPIVTNEVAEAIRNEARNAKKNKVLIVPHELASHEAVVTVIDAAALAGITSVTLADITTQPLSR
jgi:biopolymer transport protein ExbD